MKYFLIPYIALGLMLLMPVGVSYYCAGTEMFPEYFGSPFVFSRKSLGSSLTYYYSISGILLNVGVWSTLLMIIRLLLLKLIQKIRNKVFGKQLFKGTVIALTLFSSLIIYFNYLMMGSGFEKCQNYWYFNMDEEAEKWGVECEGKWGAFGSQNTHSN